MRDIISSIQEMQQNEALFSRKFNMLLAHEGAHGIDER
jgi:hypothetical protein